MTIDESDRLGLRQELERIFSNPRHVDTLMRSLPTADHTELATRADIERSIELLGRELRAEIKSETAELTRQLAVQFRLTVLMQMGVLLAVISLFASRG